MSSIIVVYLWLPQRRMVSTTAKPSIFRAATLDDGDGVCLVRSWLVEYCHARGSGRVGLAIARSDFVGVKGAGSLESAPKPARVDVPLKCR